jgi:hypothetical protein
VFGGDATNADAVRRQGQAAHELAVVGVLLHPPVRAPAAHQQEAVGDRLDALHGAFAFTQHFGGLAVIIDGQQLAARRVGKARHQQAVAHPCRGAHVGGVAQQLGPVRALAQIHLRRAAVAHVGQHGEPLRTRRSEQAVFGDLREVLAEHHGVLRRRLAERVVQQRGVERFHFVAGRRWRQAHIGEALLVGVPCQSLRGGAATRPRHRIGQHLAAGHVEHVDGGHLAATHSRAVGEIAATGRGPVGDDGGVATVRVEIHQYARLAVGPRLRDQLRLRLRRGFLHVEQRVAGQHRRGARGGGDRQLLHARIHRLAIGHRRQHLIGIGVLRLDPRQHGGILRIFQPAVRVVHGNPMQGAGSRVAWCGRRLRRGPGAVGFHGWRCNGRHRRTGQKEDGKGETHEDSPRRDGRKTRCVRCLRLDVHTMQAAAVVDADARIMARLMFNAKRHRSRASVRRGR